MLDSSLIEAGLRQFGSRQTPATPGAFGSGGKTFDKKRWRTLLSEFLPRAGSRAQKIGAIETILRSPAGVAMREAMARWIVDEIVPVETLVPEAYVKWRPPVRDAMIFVVSRLSPARLAPKLLEQIELPKNTSPEARLLRLIAKVPGLQKLGQVIARNRHLSPALRRALARLENGIRDVDPQTIRALIQLALGSKLKANAVQIAPTILSEASVSAVVRFTWRNPASGRRERGVFKVLKPHIPGYFAEDMEYLHGLAEYFGERHHNYGFPADLLPDTFTKVRRLLKHEVNFVREQKTLVEAGALYEHISGVRVPQVIRPLCTPQITALTEERGIKVTDAAARLPAARRPRISEQIVEALVAVPLLSSHQDAMFHGDPHAGNLLYDNRAGDLIILDWALREHLTREQRRHLALFFLTVSLRDPVGSSNEIRALSQHPIRSSSPQAKMIRGTVAAFLDELPATSLPSGADAMRLLERLALKGVKFPGPLIMLSKVIFTLEGILRDIGGSSRGMGLTIARHVVQHWIRNRGAFRSPLKTRDWVTLQCSALLYSTRWWLRAEQAMLERWLPASASLPQPSHT